MKRIILTFPIMFCFMQSFPQALQLQAGFGATLVNVKKVIGTELINSNTYSYEFVMQGLLKSKHDKFKWLPEIGVHRLYYWEGEYTVYTPTASQRWRWSTVWTAHAGFGIEKSIFSFGYLQTGANVRYFLYGSGITPGLMAGIGFKYPVSGKLMIPLGVRLDVVFGKSTPSSLCVCTGLQFGKRDR
jgi:hypothetical protein